MQATHARPGATSLPAAMTGAASTLTFRPPTPRGFLRIVAPVFALLVACGLASASVVHETSSEVLAQLSKVFLFDRERNLPTLFNFSLLLGNAGLCALAAVFVWRDPSAWRLSWATLAGLMFLMAFDEAAQLHERTGFLGSYLVTPTGAFRLPWVVVGGTAVTLTALAYARFVFAQCPAVRSLILIAGAVFVSGALGVEMLAAGLTEGVPIQTTTGYELLATAEETLEMLGLIAFACAVLAFLGSREVRPRDLT